MPVGAVSSARASVVDLRTTLRPDLEVTPRQTNALTALDLRRETEHTSSTTRTQLTGNLIDLRT